MNHAPSTRRDGYVLFLALVILVALMGLVAALGVLTQSNVRQSNFFFFRSELYAYAESGIDLALHDMQNSGSDEEGNIGTFAWTAQNDTGKDGKAGTGDEGDGDGDPTPGEANVVPVSVGPADQSIRLITWVRDIGPGVRSVSATATAADVSVTVEKVARENAPEVPVHGAFYLGENVELSLNGNAFDISGNDTNPDGTSGSAPPLPGITVAAGDTPGENAGALESQLGKSSDQVVGAGGEGSVGEVAGIDFEQVFGQFKAVHTTELAPGSYSQPQMGIGDWASRIFEVTYVKGDVEFAGKAQGAGVLVVEGTLTLSGQSAFYGLVIVKGDVQISGGGAGVHVWGTMMVGETAPAVASVSVSGTSELYYSSAVLAEVQANLPFVYEVVFFEER